MSKIKLYVVCALALIPACIGFLLNVIVAGFIFGWNYVAVSKREEC